MNLKIASRRSKLALVQTDMVAELLKNKFGINTEKLLVETEGDIKLDISLDKIGGKGLFVKDIELKLIDGTADAAVHSMKDVPYEIADVFEIAAMPVREDVRDVFVSISGEHFLNLQKGARIGTSSVRRASQIKFIRPDIEIVPIRGNVQTRINKIEKEKLNGIILAAAGLKRLGMEKIITDYFEPCEIVPAVGQGALGVETLKCSPSIEFFRGIDNINVRVCVEAERSFMRRLNGGCHMSIGAYAVINGEYLNITGMFEVGGYLVKKDIEGKVGDYIGLGERLAEKIIKG